VKSVYSFHISVFHCDKTSIALLMYGVTHYDVTLLCDHGKKSNQKDFSAISRVSKSAVRINIVHRCQVRIKARDY